jgi:hypothetical protein
MNVAGTGWIGTSSLCVTAEVLIDPQQSEHWEYISWRHGFVTINLAQFNAVPIPSVTDPTQARAAGSSG